MLHDFGSIQAEEKERTMDEMEGWLSGLRANLNAYIHIILVPENFVDHVERGVDYERVHGAGFGAEAGDTVAATFAGAELKRKQGTIAGGQDREVV